MDIGQKSPNLDPVEDNPFSVADFIQDFRNTIGETGQELGGRVKKDHEELLLDWETEAAVKAESDIARIKGIAPTLDLSAGLELVYKNSYIKIVRMLGIGALRLADKGQEQFIDNLVDENKRKAILALLAKDYRSNIWQIAGKDPGNIAARDLKTTFPIYHDTDYIPFLQAKYEGLGDNIIKAAVALRPVNPYDYLEFCLTEINALKKTKKYQELSEGFIKQAVIQRPSNPAEHLDEALMNIELLQRNKIYISKLGSGVINTAVFNYPSRPKEYLDSVIQKLESLEANQEFSENLSPGTLKHAAVHYADPEAYLRVIIDTMKDLAQHYHPLSLGKLERAAVNLVQIRKKP